MKTKKLKRRTQNNSLIINKNKLVNGWNIIIKSIMVKAFNSNLMRWKRRLYRVIKQNNIRYKSDPICIDFIYKLIIILGKYR